MITHRAADSFVADRATYATLVERAVREMVLDGSLEPGARINEVELAQQFQISRGPLREALQRLKAEGLLEVRAHRGAFVREFDAQELQDLYSLRSALETWAVRHSSPDAGQLADLTEMLAAARSALADPDAQYPQDRDFHRKLVALAKNPVLTETHESTLLRIQLARVRSARVPARAHAALQEHEEILRNLVAGRRGESAAALERHLDQSYENARSLLNTRAGAQEDIHRDIAQQPAGPLADS